MLMAKTGLFFAHADGSYDRREIRFIDEFLASVNQGGDIAVGKAEVERMLAQTYTLDGIIAETRQLLASGMGPSEQQAVLQAIASFAESVVEADGRVTTAERTNLDAWKKAFALA